MVVNASATFPYDERSQEPPIAYVLAVADDQVASLLNAEGPMGAAGLCVRLAKQEALTWGQITLISQNKTHRFHEYTAAGSLGASPPAGITHTVLLLCGMRLGCSMSLEWHFTNDFGREELSMGAVPLKTMPIVTMALWTVAAAALACGMLYAWFAAPGVRTSDSDADAIDPCIRRPVRDLHVTLLCVLVACACDSAILWRYYMRLSATGIDDDVFSAAVAVTQAFSLTSLLAVLLLVSHG